MTLSRRTIVLLVLALLLVVGLFFVFSNFASVQQYFKEQKLQAEIRELERPYREDIYGGSTPEETYELFIQALKEGNIELAAKYFSPKRQEDWLKELQAQKEQNKLDEFIANLPNLNEFEKEVIDTDRVSFSKNFDAPEEIVELQGKKFTIPAGIATYQVVLLRNEYTNKWKIEIL